VRQAGLRVLLSFVLLPLLALSSSARAAAAASAASDLIARARALRLADKVEWLRLGHWRRTIFGGWKSEADGPDFFLAPEGKTDAAAELEATLRALFGLVPLTADQAARNVMPAACRFPARAAWLLGKLAFDPSRLPAQECPRLDEYWNRMRPDSATLVFSSYYLNNPASAFGHTFLRVHKRDEGVPAEKRELLDQGIDYSATADTKNPVLYAFKGLTGLFRGSFHLFPYYYKVREYNDYESRDIWEYDLNLAPPQLTMLVAHLFELGSTWFDYYYIDENCSYHVLAALEAADPELQLLNHIKTPVVPADTVKALYANPGLVREVHYRPSAMTQFLARIDGMPRAELNLVQELSANPETDVPPGAQIRLLDAAADLIDVRYAKELPIEPEGKGAKIKQRVLERRAEILEPSPPLDIPPPLERRPDLGHGSTRVSTAALASSERGPVVAFRYRMGLHDLADPPAGYPELSQIEFLPTELRIYPRDRSLELESVELVDVISLHPVSRFDQALSWRVRAGSHRLRDGGCDGCLAGSAAIGSGFTVATTHEAVAVFAFADAQVDTSPSLAGIERARAVRAGVGPSGGVRIRRGGRAVLLAAAEWRWFPAAVVRTAWSIESSLRIEANRWLAIGLAARKEVTASEAGLQVFVYY